MGDNSNFFKSYGPTVLNTTAAIFASFFALKTLYTITSQRVILIAIFMIIWFYIIATKTFIKGFLYFEESIDFYKMLISLSINNRIDNQDEDDVNYYTTTMDELFDYTSTSYSSSSSWKPIAMYIDENNDVIIRHGTKEIVYVTNKKEPVKEALLQLCDFILSIVVIVIMSILVDIFFTSVETATLSWYNYVVIITVPVFLLFVFLVFKQY